MQLDDFLFLARRDRVRLELMISDLPDLMAETTEDCSSHDNIFAIFSNLDAGLRPLGPSSPDRLVRPSSPAVPTDPEVIVISPPKSPVQYLSNPVSTDGQYSPDSTSTIEASENDITVEVPPTADVQILGDHSIEDQQEPPPAYPFPPDGILVLSRPNQFKHRTETANLVNSRQHRREQFASKPTAIIRPRINSRLRYGLKSELDSWKTIFWDNQRKELTIQNTSLPSQQLVVPQQAVTVLPHQDA